MVEETRHASRRVVPEVAPPARAEPAALLQAAAQQRESELHAQAEEDRAELERLREQLAASDAKSAAAQAAVDEKFTQLETVRQGDLQDAEEKRRLASAAVAQQVQAITEQQAASTRVGAVGLRGGVSGLAHVNIRGVGALISARGSNAKGS